jgi:chromosome segregation ATPase
MAGTKDSIESMKMRYENLKSEYEQKRLTLENDLRAYNARVNAFNAEIESWNRQGGALETHRSRLTSAKNELNSDRESLSTRQDTVKKLADEVNCMMPVINETVVRQNQDVEHYRDVGSRLSGEFQERFIESKEGKQSITIYHFDNEAKLVRLLVHEFGHALRLNHSNNPNAVMYRLNQFDAAELTTDDIDALKARCEGK